MRNLQELIDHLRGVGEIVDVYAPVDPHLELAEIHRRVIAQEGPALLFHNVKGSSFPVVTNLYGTIERVELAFGRDSQKMVGDLVDLATKEFPPSLKKLYEKRGTLKRLFNLGFKKRSAPVLDCEGTPKGLSALPLITSWPEDGGPFITLPLVYTEPVTKGPPNLGMYRVQRHSDSQMGLHFQIAKGGGFHYHEAEQLNTPLPVSIFLGGPPALTLSAITPLPENVPELLFCSLLLGSKLGVRREKEFPHPVIGECEFVLMGEAKPHIRKDEGPFGDHYGYYSLKHPYPVFDCKRWFHKKGAIYPATVVGKPRQEDYFIGNYLQNLLSPLFPIVMPSVKSLWSYGETGFHSLTACVVKERFAREAVTAALRILGEGQLSLTKFLLVTDQPVDVTKIDQVLPAVLERFHSQTDLYVIANLSYDTLDYTSPKINHGSRGLLIGVGEKVRELSVEYQGSLKARPFCPGCLVVEGDMPPLDDPHLAKWPLVILVDSIDETLKDEQTFLWTVFTRFEPAQDIHAKSQKVHRHHLCYECPILIDARFKSTYPKDLEPDDATDQLVTRRWNEYFP